MKYYTYIHKIKGTNTVFYVGEGTGRRYRCNTKSRPDRWHEINRDHGYDAEIVQYYATREDALAAEKTLMAYYRGIGAPLVNVSDGRGSTGVSSWNKGTNYMADRKWFTDGVNNKRCVPGTEPHGYVLGKTESQETKQRRVEKRLATYKERGYTFTLSEQAKETIRAASTGRSHTEATIERIKAARAKQTNVGNRYTKLQDR